MAVKNPHVSIGVAAMIYIAEFVAVDGGIQRLAIPQLNNGNTFIEFTSSVGFSF